MNSFKNTYILAYFMVAIASSWSIAVAEGGLKFAAKASKKSLVELLIISFLPSRFIPFATSTTQIVKDWKTKITYNIQEQLTKLLKEEERNKRYFEEIFDMDPLSISKISKKKHQKNLSEALSMPTKPAVKTFDDLSPNLKELLKKIENNGFINTIWEEIATAANGWHYKVTGNYDRMNIELRRFKPCAPELTERIVDPENPKNIIPVYNLILRYYDRKDAGKNTENKIIPEAIEPIFKKIVNRFVELGVPFTDKNCLRECPHSKYIIAAFEQHQPKYKQKA
jgi:hypothetical protein